MRDASTNPKILLVMPKHRRGDTTFPFGIATIYSVLKENGYETDLIDCSYDHTDLDQMIGPEAIGHYDIIGIGGLVSCYRTVKYDVAPFIRANAPNALMIVGGYLGISTADLLLKNSLCDVVFLGDAEQSILEFLDVYDHRQEWKNVVGITYTNDDGSVVSTGIRLLDSLESVYVPYYKYVDIEKYSARQKKKRRAYPVVVEIGCPYSCAFCFNSFGAHTRSRNPAHVIDEIKVALEKHRLPRVDLMSENLLSRPRWVKEFCDLIDRYGLRFAWQACGHANTLNEEILRLVASHGCTEIGIGFENFSQKILDSMNKRTKVSTNARALRLMRRHGLGFSGTCIFGYPGEDHETIEENKEFLRKYIYDKRYFWIQAYPKTTLYAQCLEKGLIPDEEEYIERLGNARDFVVNLTELPDEELFASKAKLEQAGRDAFKLTPATIKRAIRLYGFHWTWKNLGRRLARSPRRAVRSLYRSSKRALRSLLRE